MCVCIVQTPLSPRLIDSNFPNLFKCPMPILSRLWAILPSDHLLDQDRPLCTCSQLPIREAIASLSLGQRYRCQSQRCTRSGELNAPRPSTPWLSHKRSLLHLTRPSESPSSLKNSHHREVDRDHYPDRYLGQFLHLVIVFFF